MFGHFAIRDRDVTIGYGQIGRIHRYKPKEKQESGETTEYSDAKDGVVKKKKKKKHH